MTQKKNRHQLLNDALNEIDEDLIEEAANVRKTKKIRWAPLAAAALLVIAAAVVLPPALSNRKAATSEDTHVTKNGETTAVLTPEAPVLEAPMPDVPGSTRASSISHEFSEGIVHYVISPEGVWSPAKEDEKAEDSAIIVTGEPIIDPEPGAPVEPVAPPDNELPVPDPGQMTAAAWNDNDHFALWRSLFQKAEQGATAGKFADFADISRAWFAQLVNRVTVTVVNGEEKVAGRRVWLTDTDGRGITSAVTDANGVAYLFSAKAGTYRIEVESNGPDTHWTGETAENTFVFDLAHLQEPAGESAASLKDDVIEIMYVIDATGSMGDELSYVKSELSDVVKKVVEANPGVTVRVSFLTYRDDEDEEKFHYEDFTDVSDEAGMKAILHELSLQDAMGGGDYEEAVDEALELAMSKSWSARSTKLIFHVLDAPAHDTETNRTRYENAVKAAAEKGIRLCPILASGSDASTEYLARSEALLTGGTFIFVTDDSGIGFGHHDPQLPDAVHEYLNALMIRLINGYHTGTFAEPVAWDAG